MAHWDELTLQCKAAMQLAALRPGKHGGRYVGRFYNKASRQDIFVTLDDDDPDKVPANVDVLAQVLPNRVLPIGTARHWLREDGTCPLSPPDPDVGQRPSQFRAAETIGTLVKSEPFQNLRSLYTHLEVHTVDGGPLQIVLGRLREPAATKTHELLLTASTPEFVENWLRHVNGKLTNISEELAKKIRDKAREEYADGSDAEIEVDENALIGTNSGPDDNPDLGWWVAGWLFVYKEHVVEESLPSYTVRVVDNRMVAYTVKAESEEDARAVVEGGVDLPDPVVVSANWYVDTIEEEDDDNIADENDQGEDSGDEPEE